MVVAEMCLLLQSCEKKGLYPPPHTHTHYINLYEHTYRKQVTKHDIARYIFAFASSKINKNTSLSLYK